MQFTRIQHKETGKILQYRINGQRVTRQQYEHNEHTAPGHYQTSSTTRTKSGNWRHEKFIQ